MREQYNSASASPQTARRDVKVFSSFEDAAFLREAWDSHVERSTACVYFTFDWCRIWWATYGRNRTLRIFVFETGDEIVGILPIYVQNLGFGPARLTVGRLVGANIPPKVFDPPLYPQFAVDQLHTAADMLASEGCEVLSIGPISDLAPSFQLVCPSESPTRLVTRSKYDVHTLFTLPPSYEEYLSSLSRNEQKNRRKYELRTLKKEFAIRVEVVQEPAAAQRELDFFIEQHTQQWNAEGKPGHFRAWPRGADYNRALVRTLAPLGRVRFIRIVANGEVISNQYVYAFGNRYTWELPSRVIGEQWERFSLGRAGITTMIQVAIQEGKRFVDGGLGHYDYKLRLNATEHPAWVWRFMPPNSKNRVRAHLRLARCADLFYRSFWYRRIAPRLPRAFRTNRASLLLSHDF